eukprot:5506475-Amphidinium_carterae.1
MEGHCGVTRVLLKRQSLPMLTCGTDLEMGMQLTAPSNSLVQVTGTLNSSYVYDKCTYIGMMNCTALHVAAYKGHEVVVDCLLEDPQARFILGWRCIPYRRTALYLA